ncbi:MAG: DNA-processing protein DprA [Burkholderiales bacterium]
MADEDWLAAWLKLCLVPGIGSVTQRRLLERFGTPAAVLGAPAVEVLPFLNASARASWHAGADEHEVQRAIEWVTHTGHHIVTLDDPRYPKPLLQTADPPALLYVRGDVDLLDRPMIAIVGSRNASPAGAETARTFASALSAAGLTVVSGLALGIDSAAHRGGLEAKGSTVAVTGTGPDLVYPARNRSLAHDIAASGAIVTEFPLGTPPQSSNFPRRNRIISGLCRGVLVVEAALRSGSLTTARLAAEQGREVMAIPGSIHSPVSRGCHSLIKQGAKLVESAEDVLEELGWSTADAGSSRTPATDEPPHDPLLHALGFDVCDLETLAARLGAPAQDVMARLLTLELEGRIAALPGGRYQRIS